MATTYPVCACPQDGPLQLLAKSVNGQAALYFLMSAGQFRAQTVNLGDCLCSESQMLATLVQNQARFFNWLVANGGLPSNAKAGVVDLALNDTSKAVTFSAAFGANPTIVAIIAAPDNSGSVVSVVVDQSTVSTTGFTALFGASIPAAGYKLIWLATPAA